MFICIKKREMKNDTITVENEGIVEYGNDFINCKIIILININIFNKL